MIILTDLEFLLILALSIFLGLLIGYYISERLGFSKLDKMFEEFEDIGEVIFDLVREEGDILLDLSEYDKFKKKDIDEMNKELLDK